MAIGESQFVLHLTVILFVELYLQNLVHHVNIK